MSRSYIYQAIKTDSHSAAPGSLGAMGLSPESVYAGDVDEPQGRRFIILRYGSRTPGVGDSNRHVLTVWAYDRDRDHDYVESLLKRVRELLEGIEAQNTLEGWITCIIWTGNSDDFLDDSYRAVGINSGYQVIASGR